MSAVTTHEPQYAAPGAAKPHSEGEPIQRKDRLRLRVTVFPLAAGKIPGIGRLKAPEGWSATEPHVHEVTIYEDMLPVIESLVETHPEEWERARERYRLAVEEYLNEAFKGKLRGDFLELPEAPENDEMRVWEAYVKEKAVIDGPTWRRAIFNLNASVNPGAFFQEASVRFARREPIVTRKFKGRANHHVVSVPRNRGQQHRGRRAIMSVEVIERLPPPQDATERALLSTQEALIAAMTKGFGGGQPQDNGMNDAIIEMMQKMEERLAAVETENAQLKQAARKRSQE